MFRKMKVLLLFEIVLTCNQIKLSDRWRRLQIRDRLRSWEASKYHRYRATGDVEEDPCQSNVYEDSVRRCSSDCIDGFWLGYRFCNKLECCNVCRGGLDIQTHCGTPELVPTPPPTCDESDSCYIECVRAFCDHRVCCVSCQKGIQKTCYNNLLIHYQPSYRPDLLYPTPRPLPPYPPLPDGLLPPPFPPRLMAI